MALNLPAVVILPDPPRKTDPSNFAERADAFLDALPTFGESVNSTIAELNKITSGLDQTTPVEAVSGSATYNFPDVVAGDDGATYRCIGFGVSGIDPVTDNGTNWLKLDGGGLQHTIIVSSDTMSTPKAMHVLTAYCTLELRPTPPVGTLIGVYNNSGLKTCVINPGSGKINGVAEPMTIDVLEITFSLMYSGEAYGWLVI